MRSTEVLQYEPPGRPKANTAVRSTEVLQYEPPGRPKANAAVRSTKGTLMTSALHHRCGASALMVLLPGALMTPQQMVDAGVFRAVQSRQLALDVTLSDLHALAGDNRDALQLLESQLLAPARGQYDEVWLGGISRGGHFALSYLAAGSGHVSGVCLLAPYPGSRITSNSIERSGGLSIWQPTSEQLRDPEFRLWNWLKDPSWPRHVFMGYGVEDRFADGMQRLASRLPGAQLHTVPGAHDWAAWLPLWERFLDRHFGGAA